MKEKLVRVLKEEYLLLFLDIFGDGSELAKLYVGHIWIIGPHLTSLNGFSPQSPLIIASEFTHPPLPILDISLDLTVHKCGLHLWMTAIN